MIQIAVLGYGNIGSGVVELLESHKELIFARLGEEINVKYILDIRDFPDHPLQAKMTKDFSVILNDPEVSIVAEMMGGSHPAYDFTASLLRAGKHVVTSNKEVVANFGDDLLSIAEHNGVRYLFEASVGGGIPIIRPMQRSLAGDEICEITGILNGTTNYILTQMTRGKKSLQQALSEAQVLGYAEANPTADVQGIDACRKICILAALAFGTLVDSEDVETFGITSLTQRDIQDGALLGRAVKLIAHAIRNEDATLTLSVSPSMLAESHPLFAVEDVFNGILVRGRAVGEVMFYGKGAGKYPTAAAVNSDILEVASHTTDTAKPLSFDRAEKGILTPATKLPYAYYLRVNEVESVSFAEREISRGDGELAVLTAPMSFADLSALCKKENLQICSAIPLR